MSDTNNSNIESLSFEAALKELEELTHKLESGQASLEDSIVLFERGAALKNYCEQKLAVAQLKVEQIVNSQNGIKTESFDGNN